LSEDINALLHEGVEAARAGDKEKARKLFEQVIEKDEENVKAWLLLYRVVDDENEKRICLTTVLQIDPTNEKARQALEKLDAKVQKTKADEEVIPGVTRRQLRLIIGGAAAVVVLILAVVLLIVSSQNAARNAEISAVTQLAVAGTQTLEAFIQQSTATANFLLLQATDIAGTQFANTSPTPTGTPTRSGPTLPPENSPTPTPTPPVSPTPLSPPSGLPGKIVAWSGRDVQNTGFLPIVVFQVSGGGQSTRVGQELGRNPTISSNGQRIIYTRSATFDYGLEGINVNGTEVEALVTRWQGQPGGDFLRPEMAQYSANDNQIVFVAVPPDTATTQLYLLNLTTAGGNPIIRLTQDQATYTYPALSPDGSKIAVVRNDKNSANTGEDIVIIDVATQAQTPLTTDFGTFIEQAPRWSPDGTKIVYGAAAATDPQNHDIVMLNSDGSGAPLLPVRSPQDDIFPMYSPDGNYLAFASNRTGAYDIFIYELATDTLYQLTSSEDPDFPGGWSAN
jgi:hypothetical protein